MSSSPEPAWREFERQTHEAARMVSLYVAEVEGVAHAGLWATVNQHAAEAADAVPGERGRVLAYLFQVRLLLQRLLKGVSGGQHLRHHGGQRRPAFTRAPSLHPIQVLGRDQPIDLSLVMAFVMEAHMLVWQIHFNMVCRGAVCTADFDATDETATMWSQVASVSDLMWSVLHLGEAHQWPTNCRNMRDLARRQPRVDDVDALAAMVMDVLRTNGDDAPPPPPCACPRHHPGLRIRVCGAWSSGRGGTWAPLPPPLPYPRL